MTDYGHEPAFGAFITPSAQEPRRLLGLAQVCEAVGLEYVTFQDHPYNNGFLDTWTLMAQVAAVTERIAVAGNVLNLPLRPPAVLARAAASLDLLSDGRLVMGLGAGGFWDAIAAFGGPRRTPGEAVEALEEAITILRALWDTTERGALFHRGAHYTIEGARRGPAPAHDIPIWIGAYRPRMLRLIGRLADGWLPSLGYLKEWRTALPGLNATLDEAAAAAGRDPAEITRVMNVPPGAEVGLLAELALDHGFSVFVVAADDPDLVEDLGRDLAPRVRERVADERDARAASADPAVAPAAGPVSAGPASTGPASAGPVSAGSASAGAVASSGTSFREAADLLVQIHDHLRTELRRLRTLVGRVVAGHTAVGAVRSAINEMTLRQNDWTLGVNCVAYCRVVTTHHSIEDATVFPHLRGADAGLGEVLDRLQREHLVVHDLLEGVDRALVGFVDDPTDASGVEEALDRLSVALLDHLDGEERDLLGPIARFGFGE